MVPENGSDTTDENTADEAAGERRDSSGAPASENFGFHHREGQPSGDSVALTDEQIAARKKRNIAIALSLVGFMVVVFLVTVTRLSQNVGS